MAVHGFSLVVASGGYSLVAGCWRLITVSCCRTQVLGVWTSVVVACRLECRFSNCDAGAQLSCSVWDLPRPDIEPMSPALQGGF